MVKARRQGKGKKDDPSRPSLFFIIAMIAGFAILVWWFLHFLPTPADGEGQETQTSISAVTRSA